MFRPLSVALLLSALACRGDDEPEDKCPAAERFAVFVDADGDGFGSEPDGEACRVGAGQADNDDDCDDADDKVHPGVEEKCNGIDDDCDGALDQGLDAKVFLRDADDDGFGDVTLPIVACAAPEGYTRKEGDCDDADPARNPEAAEICNDGIDDDCDSLADDDDDSLDLETRSEWHPDADLDGFGSATSGARACAAPAGAVADASDCDDSRAEVNPTALEVCNRIDDDCDGLLDDLDDTIDPTALIELFADLDGDGAGDGSNLVMACGARAGFAVDNDLDCDDTTDLARPGLPETLCDGLDNDCDPLTDDDVDADLDGFFACVDDCNDADPATNPDADEVVGDGRDQDCDGMEACYQDVDGDGSRGDVAVEGLDRSCTTLPNVPSFRPLDCDDNDPNVSWSGRWIADLDLDGFGAGDVVLVDCVDPGAGFLLEETVDRDCDDTRDDVFPGAPDACNDGLDADCDTFDDCSTCAEWLATDPGLPSGPYGLRPGDADPVDVWCDMDTDGGGWTLVASTAGQPLDDAVGTWHADLATLDPNAPHRNVWGGLRDVMPTGDFRVACKVAIDDPDMGVDLSFYDVDWYEQITRGGDPMTCFSPAGAAFAPPARRDNLSGATLPVGDPWDAGDLVGEDTCGDVDDFTIDFDDRGMDSDEADGTDWGEDDGKPKCGASNAGEAWFLFVR